MKQIYRFFLIFLIPFVSSCLVKDVVEPNQVEEGIPTTISLGLTFPESEKLQVETRATELNTRVYDLYLFIFNEKGTLETKYFFPVNEDTSNPNYSTEGEPAEIIRTNSTTGKINNIQTTSGTHYILAVANVNMKVGNEILVPLSKITTLDELKAELVQEPSLSASVFTMSGFFSEYIEEVSADGKVVIPASVEGESNTLAGWVHLVPTDAQVVFNITTGENVTSFEITSWQVMNLPLYSSLFVQDAEAETTYYNSTPTMQTDAIAGGYSFSFCMLERLTNALVTELATYGDRADWDGYIEGTNSKNFLYAPDNATYVIIRGRYKGKCDIQKEGEPYQNYEWTEDVDADVTYTIFLGEDSHINYKSFQTKRNTIYTYNIKIEGVRDISVEVRADNADGSDVELRSEAEGKIILSYGNGYEFDSHYGATVLGFDREELKRAIESGRMGYVVSSPYGEVSFYLKDVDDSRQAPHASWVTFVRGYNSLDGKKYPANFPGVQSDSLLTVRGLLEDLREVYQDTESTAFEDDGMVYYTAYIQEYYYDTDPNTGHPASWKDFVNTDNRKLLILARTERSQDKLSSISSVVHVLEQKSIKTIYNKDALDLQLAWGIESVEEALDLNGVTTINRSGVKTSLYSKYNGLSYKYGRQIALGVQNSNLYEWPDLINQTTGVLSTEERHNHYAVCMMRNRDLNGDGEIGTDEIRWYVPTLFQYQQMYIGMYGIEDYNARLYYNEAIIDNEWWYKHYLASNNQQILWAEEGLSNGPQSSSKATVFYFRCARDLGTNLTDEDTEEMFNSATSGYQYQNIYKHYTPSANPELTFSENALGMVEQAYLNPSSVRMTLENKEVDAPCVTFSENNRPVICFEYSANLPAGEVYSFKEQNDLADQGKGTACAELGEGWRLPTLNELSLLQQAAGYNASQIGRVMTRTKFEFYEWNAMATTDPNYNSIPANSRINNGGLRYGRYGYAYSTDNRFYLPDGDDLWLTKERFKIRCVKDHAPIGEMSDNVTNYDTVIPGGGNGFGIE